MANRYTQIQNTPYVPTYQPINFSQVGGLMAQGANFQMQEAQARAEADALLSSVAPNDPEGQEFIKALDERQRSNLANSDEPLAQRAIRARTAGIKTAGAVKAYQGAKQQIADWEEGVLEANKDISDQEELRFRMARNRPSLNYDLDNYSVSADIPATFKLAKDVNYAEKADEYMSGIKERTTGIDRRINPDTGEVEITTSSGVSKDRARAIFDTAFASDPEVQQYRRRRADYYSQVVDEQGAEETLDSLLSSAPNAEAREEIMKEVNKNKDVPLSNVLGNLMATNEIRNAQGFGTSKYAYSTLDTKFREPLKGSAIDRVTNNGYGLTEYMNNPQVADISKEFNVASILPNDMVTPDSNSRNISPGLGQQFVRGNKSQKNINNLDIDELLTSENAKERYGNSLKSLHEDIGGKPEGMNNEEYLNNVLGPAYNKKVQALSSIQRGYKTIDDPDTMQDLSDIVIGKKTDSGSLGLINRSKMKNQTVGMETKDIALSDLADSLGVDLSSKDGRKAIQDRLSIIGTTADGSGYFVRAYEDDGWLGTDNKELIIEVENPNVKKQNTISNKFFEFTSSPSKKKEKFTIPTEEGEVEFEAIAKDAYIDPETGQPVPPTLGNAQYQKIITFSDGENTYEPGDEGYENIIANIQNN